MNAVEVLYRVEDPESHVGPYRLGHREYVPLPGGADTHPTPQDEGYTVPTPHHQCAFASMEQARDWFDEDTMRALFDAGWVLSGLEVHADSVTHLGRQSVFDSGAVIRRWHLTNDASEC